MTSLLKTAGGRVAYEVFGSGGTPVVAVPGIGDTRASYRAVAPALAKAGHTVYLMDLRGHGESDTGFPSYTSEDIGDDVVALLESLDLSDAVLLGNSVGAAAISHASLRSDRVSKLVMLSGFLDDPPRFGLLRVMLMLMFIWPWGVWMWGKYRKTLFATPPDDMDANHESVMANFGEFGRLKALRAMMVASKASIAKRLKEVSAPVLILMGAEDPDFPDQAAEAESQSARLGQGGHPVVMIEGAGHYPQIEQPDSTVKAILEFMG